MSLQGWRTTDQESWYNHAIKNKKGKHWYGGKTQIHKDWRLQGWHDSDKVTKFLHEYQDLFPTNFMDLKGIIGDLDVMKITLKPNANPVKKRPYHLNQNYKEKVCLELDEMLAVGIIELVEESD